MNCTNNSTPPEQHAFERHFMIPLLITGGTCLILNGSVLAFFIKRRHQHLKNTYQVFVLLLAITGILIGLATSLNAVRDAHPLLEKSKTLCILQTILFINGFVLSLLQAFLISLQRFLAVRKTTPVGNVFLYRYRYYLCLATWTIVVAITVGCLSPPEGEEIDVCLSAFVYQGNSQVVKIVVGCTAFILVSTLVLYCYTLRHLWAKHNQMQVIRSIVKPVNYRINSNVQPSFQTASGNTETQKSKEDENERVRGKTSKVEKTNTRNAISKMVLDLKTYVVDTDGKKLEESGITTEKIRKIVQRPRAHTWVRWEESSTTVAMHLCDRPLTRAKKHKTSKSIVLVSILISLLSVFAGPIVFIFLFDNIPLYVNGIALCVSSINSTINPVLYCWRTLDLLKNLKNLFRVYVH